MRRLARIVLAGLVAVGFSIGLTASPAAADWEWYCTEYEQGYECHWYWVEPDPWAWWWENMCWDPLSCSPCNPCEA